MDQQAWLDSEFPLSNDNCTTANDGHSDEFDFIIGIQRMASAGTKGGPP
jgi:hypothetical protein